jgi:NADH-quinone oxidoreductase subunit L
MIFASIIALGVLFWALRNYAKNGTLAKADDQMNAWETLSAKKLYIDEIYDLLFVQPLLKLSQFISSVFDIQILRNGVYALANGVVNTAVQTRKWQNGLLSSYLFWMVLGIILFISYYILKISVWH